MSSVRFWPGPAYIALALFTCGAAAQQPSPVGRPPTGLIVGTVVDGDSGSPVSGAIVTLGGLPAPAGPPNQVLLSAPRVMTSPDGRFLFRDLPRGSFTLSVTEPGYLPGTYGRRSPTSQGSQLIDLEDAQRVGDAKISVWKYAALTGTLTDEAGEPVVGVNVRAVRRTTSAGRPKLVLDASYLAGFGSQFTMTDDRGMYRLARLAPGDYVVYVPTPTSATTIPVSTQDAYRLGGRAGGPPNLQREIVASSAPSPAIAGVRIGNFSLGGKGGGAEHLLLGHNDEVRAYPTTFYPAAMAAAQATAVTLRSAEDRGGIDIQIRPMLTVRVAGAVIGPNGPQANLGVRLVPASAEEFTGEPIDMNMTTMTDGRGEFTFLGVPPGPYVLRTERVPPRAAAPDAPIPADAVLWAALPIAASSDNIGGVIVRLRAGLRIAGRVEFEGTAQRPAGDRVKQIRVLVNPASGFDSPSPALASARTGQVDNSGLVTTYGQPAGTYLISVSNLPAGWALKSAVSEGRDVSVTPLELEASDVDGLVVTLTDHPTELAGIVRTAQGTPDANADVVVFPIDPRAWTESVNARTIRAVRVARDGTYKLTGLPTGDYFVAALPDEALSNWSDAKALEALAKKATRVRVAESGRQQQDLQTIQAKRGS